eukprot:FR738600.1.p1 GENE.FR738600.1~~FR738600.1.p1  ORF type:complete len:226 (+),score=17.50 FR738600.1:91-678(+)
MERLHLAEDHVRVKKVTSIRDGLEACGMIWFVIGNMWLFASNPTADGCDRTLVFYACCIMIACQYAQICLPCVAAILLVPVFCFCLPCFVRLVATIHDPMQGKGADIAAIEQLPLVTYKDPVPAAAEEPDDKPGCAICLGDFVSGDTVRVLPCKHQYHRGCVDQWLLVNATCPSCRFSILPDQEGSEDEEERSDR